MSIEIIGGRKVDGERISRRNAVINTFFDGLGGKEWFNPRKVEMPKNEVRRSATSMLRFFEEKRWHAGGAIPDELLFTRTNMRLLNNITIFEAVGEVYDAIAATPKLARTRYEEDVEIDLTMAVLRECGAKRLPQDHFGGLLVLYFILCEKVVLLSEG